MIRSNFVSFVLRYKTMEIKQRLSLNKLLVPELNQSLKILSLPLLGLKNLIENELLDNPFLESEITVSSSLSRQNHSYSGFNSDFRMSLITKEPSLQDVLQRQLGMFVNTDKELKIGQEIIGNIDDNGYLKVSLVEIAGSLNVSQDLAENVLKAIQQFEPAGVAARSISECLLIQLEQAGENDPALRKIVECHLEDVAKKNYNLIAKALKETPAKIEHYVKRILRLDPKPGRNYSPEESQQVIPDIVIDEDLGISINDEDIPTLNISKAYKEMLKDSHLDPKSREFMSAKLANALALLRSVFRRKQTLRKIVETVAEIQQDAIMNDLSLLKPLTFRDVAEKIGMHETTVCRAIMNKYVKLPAGVVALKSFFPSHIHATNGESVSSLQAKMIIKELIGLEDKKHPLSDNQISEAIFNKHGLKLARRTVVKYREELKIPSSIFRKER